MRAWVIAFGFGAAMGRASAEPSAAPATQPGWFSLAPQLDLMTGGNVTISAAGNSASGDLDTAIGLGAIGEYQLSPLVGVGLAPRLAAPIRLMNATDSGYQFDMRGRVTVGKEVAPRVHLHGIATLGYSWIVHVISENNTQTGRSTYVTPSGLILGFGAGVYYSLSPRLSFTGELSYQLGWQGTTVSGTDVRASDNFLILGIGLLAAFQ